MDNLMEQNQIDGWNKVRKDGGKDGWNKVRQDGGKDGQIEESEGWIKGWIDERKKG